MVSALDVVRVYQFGVGVIEPTGGVSDGQLVAEIEVRQKPLEDPRKVCIDERHSVGTLKSNFTIEYADKQPVREKLAGGALTTMVAAARMVRWSGFTQEQLEGTIDVQIEAVADFLHEAGEPLATHTATNMRPHEDTTKCGATDNLPEENKITAEHGNDATFKEKMQRALGDNFNETVHNQNVSNAAEDDRNNAYVGFRPKAIVEAVLARGGVVEVLDASKERPDIDPHHERHGHFAEGLKVNSISGQSNDRDATEIDFFQADASAIVELCQKMAGTKEEFAALLHAAVAFQFAVEYKLTKNMRDVF